MTRGDDWERGTATLLFTASQVSVSSSQYRITVYYNNEYNGAIRQLRQIVRYLQQNFKNDLNITNVQAFFSNITTTLNANVQQLTVKYSPDTVRSYIIYFYQTFLDNLLSNNGAQAEIRDLNLLYIKNILNPNATLCINEYERRYDLIFSTSASNFSEMMEREISVTDSQLESMRSEIITIVVKVVNTLSGVIANRATARQQFDEYVRKTFRSN